MNQIIRAFQDTALLVLSALRATLASIRENSGMAALSVVLAFGLWIFVTDSQNPARSRVLPEDIFVEAVNVPPDVVLAEQVPPVRVRVRVAEDVFQSLTAADFEAIVDLDGLGVGTYELPVDVRPLTRRGNLRVEEVLPSRITVTLVQLVSKSVPVEAEIEGSPPPGFTIRSAEAEESTVLVTGSQETVAQVAKAVALVNVDGRTAPVDQSVRLTPRDRRGFLVRDVTLEPSVAQVSIDIQQEEFSRSLAVSPTIGGAPADGYNVVSVSVNPGVVTVQGSRAFIENAAGIPTRVVDISGATDDVVRSVSLDVPAGASITGGVPVVTVTVRIDPAVGIMKFGVPVNATGLGEGLSIQGALPIVEVTLFGPLPTLRALSPIDIGATVDLKDKGAGTHRLPVKASSPQGIEVRAVTPGEIEITLEKR